MRVLRLPGTLPVVAVACLFAVTGCAGNDTSPSSPAADDRPATAAPTPTAPATAPTSPATSTGSATPLTLVDALLPTSEVPGLSASWTWQEGETGQAPTEPFGFCAKADLVSVGAMDAVERSYFPPDDSDDNAAEQIAEFPDTSTAGRAWAVLKSWHDRCGRALDADLDLQAGPLTAAPVSAGSARWYLVSWQPAGEETRRFETVGMVLHETRIAVLRMTHSGPRHSYPAGEDPMIAMVAAAARRLH